MHVFWNRVAPNTLPFWPGGGVSQFRLVRMEANANGYDEGIVLGTDGLVSEGRARIYSLYAAYGTRPRPMRHLIRHYA